MSSFFQEPPRLGNQYDDDRVLRSFLRRYLTPHVLADAEPGLRRLGGRAAGEMIELASEAERAPPVHVPFDAWGRRVDEIRVSPAMASAAPHCGPGGDCRNGIRTDTRRGKPASIRPTLSLSPVFCYLQLSSCADRRSSACSRNRRRRGASTRDLPASNYGGLWALTDAVRPHQ